MEYQALGHKTRHFLVVLPVANILANLIMFMIAFFYATFSMETISVAADFQSIQPLIFCVVLVFSATISMIVSVLMLSRSSTGLHVAGVMIFIPLVAQVALLLTTLVVTPLFFTSYLYTANAPTKLFYALHIAGGVSLIGMLLFTLLFAIAIRLTISNGVEQ